MTHIHKWGMITDTFQQSCSWLHGCGIYVER